MKPSWNSVSWVAELSLAAVKWNLSHQWAGPPSNWITTDVSVAHRTIASHHVHSGQIHFSFLQSQYSTSRCHGPSQLCWPVLFLSPFAHWQRRSTSHFAMNLLVARFLQPSLWALLCCPCCTVILLQITSAKRPVKVTWAAWLCLQQHAGLAVSLLPPPSHCWLEGLQGKTTAHPAHVTYTPGPSSSSPAVPKHHQSPTDCVDVAMTDQDQPLLPIKSNNSRHKELWKKLLFNVQKFYIQVQHVTSVLMM